MRNKSGFRSCIAFALYPSLWHMGLTKVLPLLKAFTVKRIFLGVLFAFWSALSQMHNTCALYSNNRKLSAHRSHHGCFHPRPAH